MIFIFTFIIVFISFSLMGIGFFLTGKSKLKKRCGTRPQCKKTQCDLCKNKHEDED